MATTYEPIATTTLSSAASSVTFSSISGSYTDLILVSSNKSAGNAQGLTLQFNSDTSYGNYGNTYFYATSSAVATGRTPNHNSNFAGRSVTVFGTGLTHIFNYAQTNTYKTVMSSGGGTNTILVLYGDVWLSTSAITSILIKNESAIDFSIGSMFTLYGVKAA